MKNLNVVFLVLLFLAGSVSSYVMTGGWTPIKNIKDPHVTEIAEFAVTEHNKQSGEKLKLLQVIRGETQVVAGSNYRLELEAAGGSAKNYQAVVYERSWQHFRNLTSFTPSH